MDRQILPPRPCLLHEHIGGDVAHLADQQSAPWMHSALRPPFARSGHGQIDLTVIPLEDRRPEEARLHHAMPDRASGFCVYNDPAVAIAWLLGQGAQRVAYVDVDVHHGDGVEAAFYNEALTKAGVPLFAYGNFITVALNFMILAFIIFVMVKQINRLRRKIEEHP